MSSPKPVFIYVVFSSIEIPERYPWGLYDPFCIRIGLMSRVRHPADSPASLDWELEQRTPIKKYFAPCSSHTGRLS
jgi:hypothetical protein